MDRIMMIGALCFYKNDVFVEKISTEILQKNRKSDFNWPRFLE